MAIELRILGGARAGYTESFDKQSISIGRHPTSDLRFDAKQDLDVSSRHGEIRCVDSRYTIYDNQSTNGTFVNGTRVPAGGSRVLQSGDTVTFGEQGPKLQVKISGSTGAAAAAQAAPAAGSPPKSRAMNPELLATRRPTQERVAIAVKEQTRSMRNLVIGAFAAAVVIASGAIWYGVRAKQKAQNEITQFLAENQRLQGELKQQVRDSSVLFTLQQRSDSLAQALKSAQGASATASAKKAIQNEQALQRQFGQMDLSAIRSANDPAIVLLNVEFSGQSPQEATGFSINSSGVIVTNRHVVDENGARATHIHVKFANSRTWRPAHIVKLADDPKVDLALVQLDQQFYAPSISSLAPKMDAAVGNPIWTLGFPEGTKQPMEGSGNDLAAKTTLTVGTISKSITDLLQVDAFATHGSSGSPVFDGRGRVIGVIWGGDTTVASSRIVYAVPAERVVELVKGIK